MQLDRLRSRLTLAADELAIIMNLLADPNGATEVPACWTEAGIVTDGQVDETVAAMVVMMVAPLRAVSIQRLGSLSAAPLTVGLGPSGNAVVTEPVDGDQIQVTATTVRLLPASLLHAVHLDVGTEQPTDERTTVRRSLGSFDVLRNGLAFDEQAMSNAAFPDEVGHPALVWRGGGAWRGHEVDTTVTVVDGGSTGLWFVEHEIGDADTTGEAWLRFEPCSPREAAMRLGDVVTGRTAPRPNTVPCP